MLPVSAPEQIRATEGGESIFASNSNFSATVSFRLAIDVHFSSTDRSLFSAERIYSYCCQQAAKGKNSSESSEVTNELNLTYVFLFDLVISVLATVSGVSSVLFFLSSFSCDLRFI